MQQPKFNLLIIIFQVVIVVSYEGKPVRITIFTYMKGADVFSHLTYAAALGLRTCPSRDTLSPEMS